MLVTHDLNDTTIFSSLTWCKSEENKNESVTESSEMDTGVGKIILTENKEAVRRNTDH